MKISIKTLQNRKVFLEVADTDSVLQIKDKLEQKHNIGPVDKQTLIYKGKILQDKQNFLKDFNVKETDFIIVMISKKAKSNLSPSENSNNATEPAKSSETVANTATTALPSQTNPASPLNLARAIQGEDHAIPIMSGSENSNSDPLQAPVQSSSASSSRSGPVSTGIFVSNEDPNYMSMQEARALSQVFDPNFDLMNNSPIEFRPMIRSGEDGQLEISQDHVEILQNLGFTHEQIVQALRDTLNNPNVAAEHRQAQQNIQPGQPTRMNREMFNSFLNNMQDHYSIEGRQEGERLSSVNHSRPGSYRIEIPMSLEDRNAVERLENLGFESVECIQMYIACDRNEELAANLLCEDAVRRQQEQSERRLSEENGRDGNDEDERSDEMDVEEGDEEEDEVDDEENDDNIREGEGGSGNGGEY